jgi:TolB-like protein/DNA-binding winged helix-turn-helix (wHTH) protein
MTGDFHVGTWLVQPSLNSVACNGTTVSLSPKVMQVLVCLARHPGTVVPKETLFQEVWRNTFVTDDVLKHAISELRRVFADDAREPRVIQTIAKRGYRLVAAVGPVNGTNDSSTLVEQPPVHRAMGASPRRWWARAAVATVILLSVLLVVVRRTRSASASGGPIQSLAVLPFQNLSGDPAQEYFSDGMTDVLITDLAQINSVRVISRTSVMHYRKSDKSLPEIARELNVDAIVEGTVQRLGDRVRITAQLIQAPADRHLWANSYDGNVSDVFALQREITHEIAGTIRVRIAKPAKRQVAHATPANRAALEAYLRGNYYLRKEGRGSGDEETRRAAPYFQQAIDADPDFAPAYVGLAEAHDNLLRASAEDAKIRKRAAEKALEVDPSVSNARAILAYLKWDAWDWAGAEEGYRQAIALNPNDVRAHHEFCIFLGALGRLDEALKECQTAQALDPNEDHLSEILYSRREYESARKILQLMLAIHPDDARLHWSSFLVDAEEGDQKEAIQELGKAFAFFGLSQTAADIERAFATSGYIAALRKCAKALEHLNAGTEAFLPGTTAEIYALIGDKDRALYWLEQEYEHREWVSLGIGLDYLNTDPIFDPLRSDPRFKDLVRRVGLPS